MEVAVRVMLVCMGSAYARPEILSTREGRLGTENYGGRRCGGAAGGQRGKPLWNPI